MLNSLRTSRLMVAVAMAVIVIGVATAAKGGQAVANQTQRFDDPWCDWEQQRCPQKDCKAHDKSHKDYGEPTWSSDHDLIKETSNTCGMVLAVAPRITPYVFECTLQHEDTDDDRLGIVFAYESRKEHYRLSLNNDKNDIPELGKNGLVLVQVQNGIESAITIPEAKNQLRWTKGQPLRFRVVHEREEITVQMWTDGSDMPSFEHTLPKHWPDKTGYRVGVWNRSQRMRISTLSVAPLHSITARWSKSNGMESSIVASFIDSPVTRVPVRLYASRRSNQTDLGTVEGNADDARMVWVDKDGVNLYLGQVEAKDAEVKFNDGALQPIIVWARHLHGLSQMNEKDWNEYLENELKNWCVQAFRWSGTQWEATDTRRLEKQ